MRTWQNQTLLLCGNESHNSLLLSHDCLFLCLASLWHSYKHLPCQQIHYWSLSVKPTFKRLNEYPQQSFNGHESSRQDYTPKSPKYDAQ